MRIHTLSASLVILAGLGLSTASRADTIGAAATSASVTDTCTDCGFIIQTPFTASGNTVSTYSYYATSTTGSVTPVLFSRTGNTFTVTGIGAASTPVAGVNNNINFGLTSGSATTATNTYFGFLNLNGTGGTIPFSYSGAGNGGTFVLPNNPTIMVGASFTPGTTSTDNAYNNLNNRIYSINATSIVPPTPPPVIVGNPVTPGAHNDGCTDCAFVVDQSLSGGLKVTSYSYYAQLTTGTVTPLLFTRTGNTFTVTGIGQASTPTQLGVNMFNYLPTFGSNITAQHTYFGFLNQDPDGGIVTFNYTGAGNGGTFVLPNMPNITGGASFLEGTTPVDDAYDNLNNRAYSISAIAAAPEPGTLSLLGLGLTGLTAMKRLRRR